MALDTRPVKLYPTRIRLGTTSLLTLHRCEREYQRDELLQGGEGLRSNPVLVFGHAWGEGIMEYLQYGDLDRAVYHTWKSYWPQLESDIRLEEMAFYGLRAAKGKLDAILRDYEVAEFEGKPARELGFHLDINERYYFTSMMDGVLRHRRDSHLVLLENKHTHSWIDDISPMYRNSSQALMYSIVLDRIARQTLGMYNLHYFVGQFVKQELPKVRIHHFEWKKTLLDRLNLFVSLGMDVAHLQQCVDTNIFPMRGHSCFSFGRPCKYFGVCQLRSTDVPHTDDSIEKTKSEHVKEVEASVMFRFTLDEIVAEHLKLVEEQVA